MTLEARDEIRFLGIPLGRSRILEDGEKIPFKVTDSVPINVFPGAMRQTWDAEAIAQTGDQVSLRVRGNGPNRGETREMKHYTNDQFDRKGIKLPGRTLFTQT